MESRSSAPAEPDAPGPRPRITRAVRQLAKAAFHRGGGLRVVRFRNRGRPRILAAHRFPAESVPQLEARCRHLRQHYSLVSLDQISAWLLHGTPLPPHPVAMTVDDGYRDFYEYAYPVFSRYQVPVTAFLVARFMDRLHWMWWDKVTYLFTRTPRTEVRVELPSGVTESFRLENAAQRAGAPAHLIARLARLPYPQVIDTLSTLPPIFGVSLPTEPPADYAPFSWAEAREMMAGGITFGSHTMTHALLPDVRHAGVVRAELEESKRRLEEELGTPVWHFAYPNGDHDPAARDAVRAAGFRTGSTMDAGTVHPGTDPFALPRLGAGAPCPEGTFRERAAGFWPPRLPAY